MLAKAFHTISYCRSNKEKYDRMKANSDYEQFLAEVRKKGQVIKDTLADAEGVKSVCGLGLMIGIETVAPAGEIVKACLEKGVLCLTAKSKVRLLPALKIPMEVLSEAVEIIKSACAE